MTEEIKKDSTHPNLFPGIDKYANKLFTQEEKDRVTILLRKEMSEVERTRYNHEMIVATNKDKPKLDDPQKQIQRDQLIYGHERAVEIFTKDLEKLESIHKKFEG